MCSGLEGCSPKSWTSGRKGVSSPRLPPCIHWFGHTSAPQISDLDPSLTSLGMARSSCRASVTSGKDFQVSQAVFFPQPANSESVTPSEIVKDRESRARESHCGKDLMNSSSSGAVLLKEATECQYNHICQPPLADMGQGRPHLRQQESR